MTRPNQGDVTLESFYRGRTDYDAGVAGLEYQFALSLWNMLRSMPDEIKGYVWISSAYRSIAHQQELWDDAVIKYGSPEAARKWVAPPGRSNHQKGLAADIHFADPRATAWFHSNAKRFQLQFPLNHENWHIEPIGLRDGSYRTSGKTWEEGFVIDGAHDAGWAEPDPEAYTDGAGLWELDNSDPMTQMDRLFRALQGPTQIDQLPSAQPAKLAEVRTGKQMEDPYA